MANTSASGGYLAPPGLPPEDDAFDVVLQSIAAGITGIPGNLVRPRWQTVPPPIPAPDVNWCAIGVTEEAPAQGWGMRTHEAGELGSVGSDTLQVNDEVTVTASFYGPNARSFAMLFRDGLMVPQNREAMEFPNPPLPTGAQYRLKEMPTTGRFVPEIINQVTYRRVDTSFCLLRSNVTVWPIENILEVEGVLNVDDGYSVTFTQGSTPPG